VCYVIYVEVVMTKRNLTLAIDEDVIQKARVVAAKRGTSLSGLLTQELLRLVREDEAYHLARTQALLRLATGAHLGGGELPARESLHER